MSIGGGADRAWLEPVDHEGNREGVLGCHTGNTEGLNIENPEPGMAYLWQKNDAARIRGSLRDGYVVVSDSDPELAHMKSLGSANQSTVDTSQMYGDVILMKAPIEKVRLIREREHQRAQEMLRSGSDNFLSKVTQAEVELDPRGKGTRFALGDHRMKITAGFTEDSPEIDEWSPEHGILK